MARMTVAQLAEKVDSLANVVSTLVDATISNEIAEPAPQPKAEKIKVDDAYRKHQRSKAAAHATAKGVPVVLYARRNKAGQIKVAYALKERYEATVQQQQSCLGALEVLSPAASA